MCCLNVYQISTDVFSVKYITCITKEKFPTFWLWVQREWISWRNDEYKIGRKFSRKNSHRIFSIKFFDLQSLMSNCCKKDSPKWGNFEGWTHNSRCAGTLFGDANQMSENRYQINQNTFWTKNEGNICRIGSFETKAFDVAYCPDPSNIEILPPFKSTFRGHD